MTGYLVFDGGYFAQILEAEAAALDQLMPIIEADGRHRDLRLLLCESIAERHFAQTCMGCTNLAAPVHLDTSGLRGLLRDVTGRRQLCLPDALEFFRLFVDFRNPRQAALLTL